MSISFTSISSTTSAQSLRTTSATSATSTTSTDASSSGDQVKKSKMGQMMEQLQALEKSDPAKAKEVLTKISEQLAAKAEQSGDTKMADLAKKFSAAAESGDLSALKPPKHPSGPPPSGAEAYKRQQGSANPMETIESAISSALAS